GCAAAHVPINRAMSITDRSLRIVRRSKTTIPTDVFDTNPAASSARPPDPPNSGITFGRSVAVPSGSFPKTPKSPKSPELKVYPQLTSPTQDTENPIQPTARPGPGQAESPAGSPGSAGIRGAIPASSPDPGGRLGLGLVWSSASGGSRMGTGGL